MIDFLIYFSSYISNVFSPIILILFNIFLCLLYVIYLNIKKISYKEIFSVNCPKSIKAINMIFISLIVSGVLSQIIKISFRTQRPEDMLVDEIGYAFISAHTAMSFSVTFMIIYLLFKYFKDHRYYINLLHSAFFISLASLVSVSRLVLQVHRVIDVIGGFVVAILSTYLSIMIYYSIITIYIFAFLPIFFD